jgi:hypothetical protein
MKRTTLRHPRTGEPLLPLGWRRNGAPIWPILGASDDEGAGSDGSADGVPTDDGGGGGDADEGAGGDQSGEDQLGDAGKRALDAMKAKWRAERDAHRETKRRLEEAAKPSGDGEPDAETIRSQARAEAIAEANERIVRSEVKAAAAGKLNDPSDALRLLDLSGFEVDADGNVDEDEIAEAIEDLISKKPYLAAAQGGRRFQGGADGGARKEQKPPTLDERITEAQAKGDVRAVISLQNQRLAEAAGKS